MDEYLANLNLILVLRYLHFQIASLLAKGVTNNKKKKYRLRKHVRRVKQLIFDNLLVTLIVAISFSGIPHAFPVKRLLEIDEEL